MGAITSCATWASREPWAEIAPADFAKARIAAEDAEAPAC